MRRRTRLGRGYGVSLRFSQATYSWDGGALVSNSQTRTNQVDYPARGLGKAREDHVSYSPDCLLCSAAGLFSTHCQPFRQHSHLDQEWNEEACYSLKAKKPQASNCVRHQQTSST